MQSTRTQRRRRAHHMAKRKAGAEATLQGLRSCARQVMKALGKGHTEKIYHRAMITLLNKKQIAHRSEVLAPIHFLGEVVGFGRCDLVIGTWVIELKANARCPASFSPQLRKYLTSMGAAERKRFRGVIVNFNQRTGAVEFHKDGQKKRVTKKKAIKKTKK